MPFSLFQKFFSFIGWLQPVKVKANLMRSKSIRNKAGHPGAEIKENRSTGVLKTKVVLPVAIICNLPQIEINPLMFSPSPWLHLRIPFSYFLLPVYLFALGLSPNFTEYRIIWSFIIVHLLLYPASNGYNSYFDKDEQSIGGLKNPPPVTKGLYYIALLFDFLAIALALKISMLFATMLLFYGLASKAYSHPLIRLKKYPVGGWLTTGFFQGFFSLLMCYEGLNAFGANGLLRGHLIVAALLTSVLLWASYPMTQVYQHAEDRQRGDHTLSLRLGVRGTFIFSGVLFGLASIGFVLFFNTFYKAIYSMIFLLLLSPVVLYFCYWFFKVWKDTSRADYNHTMWLNFISATCLNIFFIYFFLDSSQVLQAIKAGF